jgi:succinate dehydrogenase flavin-adding protein (antitoxin of CptAB toxin-antitoxin module)
VQSGINIVFFISLATGIYFFVDGFNQNHRDKDHQLSQTFRNVALLKNGSDLDLAENDITRSKQIISVVKGNIEAAEAEIVKVEDVERESKEMIYVQDSMKELYQLVLDSNQEMLEKKQLEFIAAVNDDPLVLESTLKTLKDWLVSYENFKYEKEYEIFKLLAAFPQDKTIDTLKSSLTIREEKGQEGIDVVLNHQIYTKIAQLSDQNNEQSEYLISQGDPALMGLIQYSNDLSTSSESTDKELETKINEHILNTFYSEVENAGDERRTFWLEAFAISSNPNFRKIHLEAYNE